MSRGWTVAACLALLTVAPVASAHHMQNDSGRVIVFNDLGGSEWWLEAQLAGQDGGQVSKLEAMDDGGPWVAMAWHADWGKWAASFHIESGHRVQFRASWAGGAQQLSCWWTHPGAVEQCGSPPPPPPPPTFDATFSGVSGNNWWLQAKAAANAPIWGVDYQVDQGTWTPMSLQSWGSWTASPHVVDGSQVQFRARTAQAHDVRVCVNGPAHTADVYLDGTLVGQGLAVRDPAYPASLRIGEPVDGGLNWGENYWDSVTLKQGCGASATVRQTFTMDSLDGWTVQASNGLLRTESTGTSAGWAHQWRPGDREGYAQGTVPLASFDRTGSFELSTRFLVPTVDNHWFYVLDGAGVAVIVDYGTDLSWYNGGTQKLATLAPGSLDASGCYTWTANGGTPAACSSGPPPPPPPPPPPTSVFYDNVKGNEWWVEAAAHSKSPIAGVDTRVDGGTWVPMTLRSWGSWAASTHAVQGSHVQFRARFPDGTYAFIPNGYVWAAATQWPPSSSTFDAKFENVGGNNNWVQVNVYAPSNWGLGAVRARVDGGAWQNLAQQSWGDWAAPIHVDNGSYVEFLAFSAGQAPGGAMSGKYVWPSGHAVSAWPVEGSFVSYAFMDGFGSPGGGYAVVTKATLRLTYHAGQWAGTCFGRTQESNQPQPTGPYVVYHDYNWTYVVHEGPPTASTSPMLNTTTNMHPMSVSANPQSNSGSCGHTEVITMPTGMTRYQTQLKDRAGHALVLREWQAHHDPADYTPVSDDDYWEPHLGLMTDWFHSQEDAGGWSGHMTDTDAPIR